MPLYTYFCDEHGPMSMSVPLAKVDWEINCPLCGYNDYIDAGYEPVDFDVWCEALWVKAVEPGKPARHGMTKMIDAPDFRVG